MKQAKAWPTAAAAGVGVCCCSLLLCSRGVESLLHVCASISELQRCACLGVPLHLHHTHLHLARMALQAAARTTLIGGELYGGGGWWVDGFWGGCAESACCRHTVCCCTKASRQDGSTEVWGGCYRAKWVCEKLGKAALLTGLDDLPCGRLLRGRSTKDAASF